MVYKISQTTKTLQVLVVLPLLFWVNVANTKPTASTVKTKVADQTPELAQINFELVNLPSNEFVMEVEPHTRKVRATQRDILFRYTGEVPVNKALKARIIYDTVGLQAGTSTTIPYTVRVVGGTGVVLTDTEARKIVDAPGDGQRGNWSYVRINVTPKNPNADLEAGEYKGTFRIIFLVGD